MRKATNKEITTRQITHKRRLLNYDASSRGLHCASVAAMSRRKKERKTHWDSMHDARDHVRKKGPLITKEHGAKRFRKKWIRVIVMAISCSLKGRKRL